MEFQLKRRCLRSLTSTLFAKNKNGLILPSTNFMKSKNNLRLLPRERNKTKAKTDINHQINSTPNNPNSSKIIKLMNSGREKNPTRRKKFKQLKLKKIRKLVRKKYNP